LASHASNAYDPPGAMVDEMNALANRPASVGEIRFMGFSS
jgi:hypothetical protein